MFYTIENLKMCKLFKCVKNYQFHKVKVTDLFLTDSYRKLYPDKEAYTFWSYMGGARAKNVGWRLDYFLLQGESQKWLNDNVIHSDVMGSDHCPIELKLNISI